MPLKKRESKRSVKKGGKKKRGNFVLGESGGTLINTDDDSYVIGEAKLENIYA